MDTTEAKNVSMRAGYWLATIGTKKVIDGATPLVLEAMSRMRLDLTEPFCIADMGCADGGSSMLLIRRCIEELREAAPSRQVAVIYTDQPSNNYNALFRILHGLEEGPAPSYLADFENVFAMASGTSFYRQLLPESTLDLGFSSTAMHWLSRKPCDISDHVQAVGASGDELAAFQRQGHADWRTILTHRARELRPGGCLVLVNFCRDEHGRHLGHTEGVDIFDTFNEIWLGLLEAGSVTRDEYVRMTMPQYYNDVEELSAPLLDTGSDVYCAGLRLESIKTRLVECPFKLDYRKHLDAHRFADAYLPTLQSWSESTFMSGLDQARTLDERQSLVEHFYDTYAARVIAEPEQHGMDYVHAYVVIRKVG